LLLVDALGHFPTGRSIRSVTLVSLRSIRSIRIATFSPETTWHCDFARHDLITHPGALALRQMASSPSLLALKTSGKEFFATETTPALSRHIYEAQLATSPDTQGPRGHQERCAKGGGRRRSSGTLRLLLGLAVQSQRCRDIFCASRIERALPRTLEAANLGPPFTRPTTAPLCHQLRRCLDLAGDPIIIQEHAITASAMLSRHTLDDNCSKIGSVQLHLPTSCPTASDRRRCDSTDCCVHRPAYCTPFCNEYATQTPLLLRSAHQTTTG